MAEECLARHPEMGESPEVVDWLTRPARSMPRIQYQQSLAEIMYAGGYHEGQVLEDGVLLIRPKGSNSDVEEKAMHLLHLSEACTEMPNNRLSQQAQEQLQISRFGTEDMRQKLAKFLPI